MFITKWYTATLINSETGNVYKTLYLPRIYDKYNNEISRDSMCYLTDGSEWLGEDNMPPLISSEFVETPIRFSWMS